MTDNSDEMADLNSIETDGALGLSKVIQEMVAERGPGKSICPSEVARALAGKDEKAWRLLMKPIRAAAVALANDGRVAITRKGKPVDPNDFKGVYRLTVAPDKTRP